MYRWKRAYHRILEQTPKRSRTRSLLQYSMICSLPSTYTSFLPILMYGGEYKIKETIEKLQGNQYISSVDFYKGFDHFVLREEDREYTSFSLKDRHLHYNRTRPAYFSMAVANTFRPCR